jgi:hypothetical protein
MVQSTTTDQAPETRPNDLPTLPPKRQSDSETSWTDPWAAAAPSLEPMMSQVITDEINRDPVEVRRLRRALEEALEGRLIPLHDAMPSA